jgi:hypothetical protein
VLAKKVAPEVNSNMPLARAITLAKVSILDGNLKAAEENLRSIKRNIKSSSHSNISDKLSETQEDLAWMLHDAYEVLGDKDASVRIYREFLKSE